MNKPILCVDFDGVIHSYTSKWRGANVIPDPPVPGALKFLYNALGVFSVNVYSSRSHQEGGITAMFDYVHKWALLENIEPETRWPSLIVWPTEKPPALVTLDDRAVCFDGAWPDLQELMDFKPWNKRPLGATGKFPMPALNDEDEGQLRMAIAADKVNGLVRVDFGKPVAWLALPPGEAIILATAILDKVKEVR